MKIEMDTERRGELKHKRMGTGARPNTLKTECGKLVASHKATRWGPDVTCPECLRNADNPSADTRTQLAGDRLRDFEFGDAAIDGWEVS